MDLAGRPDSPGKSVPPFVLFALVGVANSAIDFVAFCALIWLGVLPPLLANVVSFGLGAVNSYVMNGLVTFGRPGLRLASARRFGMFALVTAICLALSTAILSLALSVTVAPVAKLASIAGVVVVGFLLNRTLVYRDPPRPDHVGSG